MAVTNYISAGDTLVGEVSGGVGTAYGLDALGSVVATYSGTAVQNTYVYKPYGAVLAKSGTAADPSFLWNGGSGYRATKLIDSEYYVRRRHYSSTSRQWTSLDPKWPGQPPYGYAGASPTLRIDPSGLRCSKQGSPQTCVMSLAMVAQPYIVIPPNQVIDPSNGKLSWAVIAVLDVLFTCVQICGPCPCPSSGPGAPMTIEQWRYDGPVQPNPAWIPDGNQECGPSEVAGCTAVQFGRDSPGVGQTEWEADQYDSCELNELPAYFLDSELPFPYELHFLTICHGGIPFDYLSPPPGDPTTLLWGVKLYVSNGSPPQATVTQTSP